MKHGLPVVSVGMPTAIDWSWLAVRESNRIARGRCIYASFGVLLLARLVSCE